MNKNGNKVDEQAVVFDCGTERLVGVVHAAGAGEHGVLIIVGGPQYRVGSHRQFLLLARYLAAHGIPVMRFDYRGMGDAEGAHRCFDNVGEDIRAAMDSFFRLSPGLKSVSLWGLCDAASAALLYAHQDSRVGRLILLNPWVHTEAGEARAYLRHYYIRRFFDKAWWRKLARREFKLQESMASILGFLKKSRSSSAVENSKASSSESDLAYIDGMYQGLQQFEGPVGVILSGDDLTAAEFRDLVERSNSWKRLMRSKSIEFHHIPKANHTFSRQAWRDEVARQTLEWVQAQRSE